MNDNSKETNSNDINVLVNENFVVNFLEPPANTSATKKKMKEFEEYTYRKHIPFLTKPSILHFIPTGKKKVLRAVDVPRFDEKECHKKALEIKELFERQDEDATLQEITRQLKNKDERKSLSKLKKYLYNRKKEDRKPNYAFAYFNLFIAVFAIPFVFTVFGLIGLAIIAFHLVVAAIGSYIEHKVTNLNNETAKKENQFKEDVLNKIKETQINSVFPKVPVENGQNLIPYSSIGSDPSISPAWIPVSNLQKRSNEISNMPHGYSSGAYNQSHHK